MCTRKKSLNLLELQYIHWFHRESRDSPLQNYRSKSIGLKKWTNNLNCQNKIHNVCVFKRRSRRPNMHPEKVAKFARSAISEKNSQLQKKKELNTSNAIKTSSIEVNTERWNRILRSWLWKWIYIGPKPNILTSRFDDSSSVCKYRTIT